MVPHELHFHMVHHLLQEHIDREVDYKVLHLLFFRQPVVRTSVCCFTNNIQISGYCFLHDSHGD